MAQFKGRVRIAPEKDTLDDGDMRLVTDKQLADFACDNPQTLQKPGRGWCADHAMGNMVNAILIRFKDTKPRMMTSRIHAQDNWQNRLPCTQYRISDIEQPISEFNTKFDSGFKRIENTDG